MLLVGKCYSYIVIGEEFYFIGNYIDLWEVIGMLERKENIIVFSIFEVWEAGLFLLFRNFFFEIDSYMIDFVFYFEFNWFV